MELFYIMRLGFLHNFNPLPFSTFKFQSNNATTMPTICSSFLFSLFATLFFSQIIVSFFSYLLMYYGEFSDIIFLAN